MSDEQHDDQRDPLEGLNERQRRFCELWAGRCAGNGTRAAREAGYEGDASTLAVTAYRLLRNTKIKSALAAFQEGDELTASRVELGHFLTRVLRGEENETRAVRTEDGKVTFEPCPPSLKDRLGALEQMAKLGGYHVTKIAATDSKGEDVKTLALADLFALAGLAKGGE